MDKKGFVYIMFNKRNGTLYTGVTSNLVHRIIQHKEKLLLGFTSKYGIDKLGYFEEFQTITEAIDREKLIKGYSRKKKIELIEGINPEWEDLFDQLI